jgi:hypothetical protein
MFIMELTDVPAMTRLKLSSRVLKAADLPQAGHPWASSRGKGTAAFALQAAANREQTPVCGRRPAYDALGSRLVREGPDAARSQPLYEHCKLSDQRLRYGFTIAKFSRFLADYGVTKVRRSSGVMLQFPPLAEIRAKFLKRNPWAEPFTPGGNAWSRSAEFPEPE